MGHLKKFETLEYKGFLWLVKGKVADREDQDINLLKQKYLADLCLRKSGILYLVEIIEEATVIEETKNQES